MFARCLLVRAPPTSAKDLARRPAASAAASVPTVSPAVVRSLYRSLYREISRLDRDPVLKVLFPVNSELQTLLGTSCALHTPGGKRYTDVLRAVFRDAGKVPKVSLAFDTLTRLRAHFDTLKAKLPAMERDRARLLASLQSPAAVAARRDLFRATAVVPSPEGRPRYVQAAPGVPTRVVLREAHHNVDLQEGTLLLAHPLSSSHVDRRVMLITERTPVVTSAVVLDLQFTYPLSRGNNMFPEVFWGHDVYDGGFSQIGFTMPPTAKIVVLHTLEPRAVDGAGGAGGSSSPSSSPSVSGVMNWLKWKDAAGQKPGTNTAAAAAAVSAEALKKHHLFCHPLVQGGVQDDGSREPTLYLSKTEALPYLGELAAGQPRSALRIYWGSMRWTTAQLEAEVANGHWMAVRASPSFFRSYSLTGADSFAEERFPTADQLAEAKHLREKRHGADFTPAQVFPPDQILRRRECLWDEIMFALGGDYAALVGCSNPFSDASRGPSVQILAPYLTPLPLTAEEEGEEEEGIAPVGSAASSAVPPRGEGEAAEDGGVEGASEEDDEEEEDEMDEDELLMSGPDTILEHTRTRGAEHESRGRPAGRAIASKEEDSRSSGASRAGTAAENPGKDDPTHHKDKSG